MATSAEGLPLKEGAQSGAVGSGMEQAVSSAEQEHADVGDGQATQQEGGRRQTSILRQIDELEQKLEDLLEVKEGLEDMLQDGAVDAQGPPGSDTHQVCHGKDPE